MLDGTYDVVAHTPVGKKKGKLVLAQQDSACTAQLTVAGKTAHLRGEVKGEEVAFNGSVRMPFPFGKVQYQLVGTVVGDVLQGTCRTKKFSFKVEGRRVA